MTDNIHIIHWEKDDAGPEAYQIIISFESKEEAEKYKQEILENKNLKVENQKLKEDAELDQDIDWGDIEQRYCPTHKKSYHLYCKECKLEIKQLRKEIQNLKSQLEESKENQDRCNKMSALSIVKENRALRKLASDVLKNWYKFEKTNDRYHLIQKIHDLEKYLKRGLS